MNTKKYILAAATLLGLAACQQEDTLASAYDTDPNAVKISASIAGVDNVQTRINTDGTGAIWTNGDMIEVGNTSTGSVNNKRKAIYVYTDKWAPSGEEYTVWADGENTFEAYYPYESGNTVNSFAMFDLPNDQSEVAKISKADWMLATATQTKTATNKAVNLVFFHQFAKVTVKIVGYNDEFTTLPGIADVTSPTFTLTTMPEVFPLKTVAVQDNSATIAALKVEGNESKHSFTAVLLPGKYSAGGGFFQFKVGSTTYKANVPASGTLTTGIEGGKAYTFNLTVGKDMMTIGSVTVEDWGESDWADGVGQGGTAEDNG